MRIKHKKEWENTHTYDKKKRYWFVKEQILLTPYFYATATDYDTKDHKTNIKLSFRFVGKPGMMADFKRLTRAHVADYYAAGLNDNARIEEADLEDDDQEGDFQYLYNERPSSNKLAKDLEAELKRAMV